MGRHRMGTDGRIGMGWGRMVRDELGRDGMGRDGMMRDEMKKGLDEEGWDVEDEEELNEEGRDVQHGIHMRNFALFCV